MRAQKIAPVVSALGLLAMVTACGAATPSAGSSTGTVPAAPATAAVVATTTTTAATTKVAAGDQASAASFKAELSIQRQDVGMVMLTNTSGHSVTVQGWPQLTFSNAHGDRLSVPSQQVEVPGPGPSITVVAGGSVFAPVTWTDGDKGDDSTYVADGVEVIPPGAKAPVVTKFVALDGSSPGYYEFAIKSVKVGTFQSSTQNLLEF
jgi:hypothetical protein